MMADVRVHSTVGQMERLMVFLKDSLLAGEMGLKMVVLMAPLLVVMMVQLTVDEMVVHSEL